MYADILQQYWCVQVKRGLTVVMSGLKGSHVWVEGFDAYLVMEVLAYTTLRLLYDCSDLCIALTVQC